MELPAYEELLLRNHIFSSLLTENFVIQNDEDANKLIKTKPKELFLRSILIWCKEYMARHAYVRSSHDQAKLTDAQRKRICAVCKNDKLDNTAKINKLIDLGVVSNSAVRNFIEGVTKALPAEKKTKKASKPDGVETRRKGKRKAVTTETDDSKRAKPPEDDVLCLT